MNKSEIIEHYREYTNMYITNLLEIYEIQGKTNDESVIRSRHEQAHEMTCSTLSLTGSESCIANCYRMYGNNPIMLTACLANCV